MSSKIEYDPEKYRTPQLQAELAAYNQLIGQLTGQPCEMTYAGLAKLRLSGTEVLFQHHPETSEVVGTAMLAFVELRKGLSALVDDVVIDERFRGQGIGRGLMMRVIDRARQRGAFEARLTSRPHRIEAHQLYSSLGFVKVETQVFRLSLEA